MKGIFDILKKMAFWNFLNDCGIQSQWSMVGLREGGLKWLEASQIKTRSFANYNVNKNKSVGWNKHVGRKNCGRNKHNLSILRLETSSKHRFTLNKPLRKLLLLSKSCKSRVSLQKFLLFSFDFKISWKLINV